MLVYQALDSDDEPFLYMLTGDEIASGGGAAHDVAAAEALGPAICAAGRAGCWRPHLRRLGGA